MSVVKVLNALAQGKPKKSTRRSKLTGTDVATTTMSEKVAVISNSTDGLRRSTLTATDVSTMKLSGKVAVITDSTNGIGLAIAERLLQDGAKVVISSRSEENVAKALEYLKSKGHCSVVGAVCHVSNQTQRAALYKTAIDNFGKIDILVSNVAENPAFGSILECSEEAWDNIFDGNVKCSFLLTKEVVPFMRQTGGGSILFICSIDGFLSVPSLGAAYSVSKTALVGLTKACAHEVAKENIRINCLVPGVVQTNFSNRVNTSLPEAPLGLIPMGRYGRPAEIAAVASFLCSNDASYITAENVIVGGGIQSRL